MAIIRTTSELNQSVNYIATLALFACVSCLILMLKFGGFKASLNFYGRKKHNDRNDEPLSMAGAYRINRSDFFENERVTTSRNNITPSMVRLPPSTQSNTPLRPAKSTSDLTAKNNPPTNLSKSVHDVSQDPRGPNIPNNKNTAVSQKALAKDNKEQIKLEKQRLAEQKATEKNAAKEREREEKLRKKREKEAAREQAKAQKEKKRRPAPAIPSANPMSNATNRQQTANRPPNQLPSKTSAIQPQMPNNNLSLQAPYSSNTLQSSISRSSGPPPYLEVATNQESDTNGGNVIFSKPIEEPTNSWDLISQHRQQMSKPTGQTQTRGPKKNMVMDLQYKLGNEDNSEA